MAETKRSRMRTPVGKELAKIRIDRDLSLADMAGEIGMHPTHLSRIETGALAVSLGFVERIKERYGLDFSAHINKATGKNRLVFDLRHYSEQDAKLLQEIYSRRVVENQPATVISPPKPVAPKVQDVEGVDFIDDDSLSDDDLSDLD